MTTESSGIVDWATASRVARLADSRRPSTAADLLRGLEIDMAELVPQAEHLVAEATGLRAPTLGRARVVDRNGWVEANLRSMQRLLSPILGPAAERRSEAIASTGPAALVLGPLAQVSSVVTGTEIGLLLSWMSTKVLGQYDLLLSDAADVDEQDLVYAVGPNVVALESRHGFARRQFRLWLALHEVTHRCQFTAVPWMRDHFLDLVHRGLGPIADDPKRMAEGLKRAVGEIRAGRNPADGPGLIAMFATPEQRDAIGQLQTLMSVLEGHGDVVMDRAGGAHVRGAARFSSVIQTRRNSARGPAKVLRQLLGIEAKLRQYAEGKAFIEVVEAHGGRALFDRIWEGPDRLPSPAELEIPQSWIDRVGSVAAIP